MEQISIIETFLYWAWLGGQALYWFFLKPQTELFREESWRVCLLLDLGFKAERNNAVSAVYHACD